MRRFPEKAGTLLNKSPLIKQLLQSSRQHQQILSQIKQLLESNIAEHCVSATLTGHNLKLFTDSSVWASRLRFQSKNLIRDLKNKGLLVQKVEIRVIPATSNKPAARKIRPAKKISHATAANLVATAETLDDAELEAALKRLAKSVTD